MDPNALVNSLPGSWPNLDKPDIEANHEIGMTEIVCAALVASTTAVTLLTGVSLAGHHFIPLSMEATQGLFWGSAGTTILVVSGYALHKLRPDEDEEVGGEGGDRSSSLEELRTQLGALQVRISQQKPIKTASGWEHWFKKKSEQLQEIEGVLNCISQENASSNMEGNLARAARLLQQLEEDLKGMDAMY